MGWPRPVIPPCRVPEVFNCVHGVSHAGGRATLREVSRRFVWPGMRSDVLRLARDCLACTASKTTRHILSPLVHRPVPGARFSSLHSDLVGPLPPSEGFRYLLTVIDRSTRQVEVIPLADMTATALLLYWISCFGVPVDITTDQGRQFTSSLCSEPHQLLESPLCGLRRTIHSQTGWWRESIE